MKKPIKISSLLWTIFMSICVISLMSSCAMPVNTNYESARSLKKNQLEAAASYTAYGNLGEPAQNNMGVRVGYGITDKFDVKITYENATTVNSGSDFIEQYKMNYVSVSPKWTFIKNVLALKIPVNMYSMKYQDGDQESLFNISPTLLATWPVSQQFEVGMSVTYQSGVPGYQSIFSTGIGMGISKNLDRWAIRPEIGYSVDLEYSDHKYVNFGIGFTYNFDLNK